MIPSRRRPVSNTQHDGIHNYARCVGCSKLTSDVAAAVTLTNTDRTRDAIVDAWTLRNHSLAASFSTTSGSAVKHQPRT